MFVLLYKFFRLFLIKEKLFMNKIFVYEKNGKLKLKDFSITFSLKNRLHNRI